MRGFMWQYQEVQLHVLPCPGPPNLGVRVQMLDWMRITITYLVSHIIFLVSDKGDQLCHAVIKSHVPKPMMANKYSNTFQMQK